MHFPFFTVFAAGEGRGLTHDTGVKHCTTLQLLLKVHPWINMRQLIDWQRAIQTVFYSSFWQQTLELLLARKEDPV